MSAATDEYNDIRKLQQTIADRDAEIARLKDECKDIYDRNVEIVTEFYPLRSRLEAAEKRYQWLIDRLQVRGETTMAGTVRKFLSVRIGHGAEGEDRDPTDGWTNPKYFEQCKERVENFITAAIAQDQANKPEGQSP